MEKLNKAHSDLQFKELVQEAQNIEELQAIIESRNPNAEVNSLADQEIIAQAQNRIIEMAGKVRSSIINGAKNAKTQAEFELLLRDAQNAYEAKYLQNVLKYLTFDNKFTIPDYVRLDKLTKEILKTYGEPDLTNLTPFKLAFEPHQAESPNVDMTQFALPEEEPLSTSVPGNTGKPKTQSTSTIDEYAQELINTGKMRQSFYNAIQSAQNIEDLKQCMSKVISHAEATYISRIIGSIASFKPSNLQLKQLAVDAYVNAEIYADINTEAMRTTDNISDFKSKIADFAARKGYRLEYEKDSFGLDCLRVINTNGKCIREVSYVRRGYIIADDWFIYDSAGNELREVSYDKNGKPSTIIQHYYENGVETHSTGVDRGSSIVTVYTYENGEAHSSYMKAYGVKAKFGHELVGKELLGEPTQETSDEGFTEPNDGFESIQAVLDHAVKGGRYRIVNGEYIPIEPEQPTNKTADRSGKLLSTIIPLPSKALVDDVTTTVGNLTQKAKRVFGLNIGSAYEKLPEDIKAAFENYAQQNGYTMSFSKTGNLVFRNHENKIVRRIDLTENGTIKLDTTFLQNIVKTSETKSDNSAPETNPSITVPIIDHAREMQMVPKYLEFATLDGKQRFTDEQISELTSLIGQYETNSSKTDFVKDLLKIGGEDKPLSFDEFKFLIEVSNNHTEYEQNNLIAFYKALKEQHGVQNISTFIKRNYSYQLLSKVSKCAHPEIAAEIVAQYDHSKLTAKSLEAIVLLHRISNGNMDLVTDFINYFHSSEAMNIVVELAKDPDSKQLMLNYEGTSWKYGYTSNGTELKPVSAYYFRKARANFLKAFNLTEKISLLEVRDRIDAMERTIGGNYEGGKHRK